MDKRGMSAQSISLTWLGNIIPAAKKPRSQWEGYLQRRQFGDEGIATHTDDEGKLLPLAWTYLFREHYLLETFGPPQPRRGQGLHAS